jgi:hypothetical protein
LFLFLLSFEYGREKSVRQLAGFFRFVEIVITKLYVYPKLNVLYQISLSEDFKNIFFFVICHLIKKKCSSEMHQFELADPVGTHESYK